MAGITHATVASGTNSGTGEIHKAEWNAAHTFLASDIVWTNVKTDYGAIGNDTADDTAAIQAAVDALESTGGTIFFPKGIYKITSEILVSPGSTPTGNIIFRGEEGAASRIHQVTTNTNGIRTTTNEYDFWVIDLGLYGPTTGSSGAGLYGNNKNVHTMRARTNGFYFGVRIGTESYYSKHWGSQFYNAISVNVVCEGSSNNTSFYDCHNTTAIGGYGYVFEGCESSRVIGGAVEGHSNIAIRFNGGGNGEAGYVAGVYFENSGTDITAGNVSKMHGLTTAGNMHVRPGYDGTGIHIQITDCPGYVNVGGTFHSHSTNAINSSTYPIISTGAYFRNSPGGITAPTGSIIVDTSYTSTPTAIGTGAAGSSAYLSRWDHGHGLGGTVGGDLSGTLPNPTVAKINGVSVSGTPSVGDVPTATSSTTATWQAGTGGGGGGAVDHEHINDLQFSGDGSTTDFELPATPFDTYSVAAYVAGVRTDVTLSGAMLTTMTFGSAPTSGTNNIIVDLIAAAV